MKPTKKPIPTPPGEILPEEFLQPMSITQYALAKAIGVSPRRINEIVHGERAITADTDLRLCKFFGLTEGYWLRGQARYDTEIAKDKLGEVLSRIQHYQPQAAQERASEIPGGKREINALSCRLIVFGI